jgi:hypothetical protein
MKQRKQEKIPQGISKNMREIFEIMILINEKVNECMQFNLIFYVK